MDTAKLKSAAKTGLGWWAKTQGYRGHLFTAFIFDLLSIIPYVGMIFTFLGYATLWLWFEIDGVNPSIVSGRKKIKKAASFFGEWLLGLTGLGIYPGITMWAYYAVSEEADEQATEKADQERENTKEAQNKLAKQRQPMTNKAQRENRRPKRRRKTSVYQ
jgi:hypothetical protein